LKENLKILLADFSQRNQVTTGTLNHLLNITGWLSISTTLLTHLDTDWYDPVAKSCNLN